MAYDLLKVNLLVTLLLFKTSRVSSIFKEGLEGVTDIHVVANFILDLDIFLPLFWGTVMYDNA